MNDRERLLEILKKLSYEEGEFVLKSGKKSNFYIDARQAALNPYGMYLVGKIFYEMLKEYGEIEAVGGVSIGGDPLVCATVLYAFSVNDLKPGFFIRKEPKGYGTNRWIEGWKNLRKGMRVAILEDVVTTGGSSLMAAEIAEREGLKVEAIFALIDRLEGGREEIEAKGYHFRSVFTLKEIKEKTY